MNTSLLRAAAWTAATVLALGAPARAQAVDAQAPDTEPPAPSACVECHAAQDEPRLAEPVEQFPEDVHHAKGLSCHDCHGGDPGVDLASAGALLEAHGGDDWLGRPAPSEMPTFCGRCHSDATFMSRFDPDARVDQVERYRVSVHGELLAQGDTKVATCISCHGRHPGGEMAAALAHHITPVDDPKGPVHPRNVAVTCSRCHSDAAYMAGYDIPTDQYDQYIDSVHWRQMVDEEDFSAPTCNDCHGNHGARPPGVQSMAFVCGTCHGRQSELFRESSMSFAFEMMEVGQCVVCHSNHRIVAPTDAMLVEGPPEGGGAQACSECHEADDDAMLAAGRMHSAITELDAGIAAARELIADADRKGMVVSDARYDLTRATDKLVEARVEIHAWAADPVLETTAQGDELVQRAQAAGRDAIDDFFFRHRWLGVSLLGIGFVIVSLLLKIRQVDRRWRASSPD